MRTGHAASARRPRVLMVTDGLPMGGLERQLALLASGLSPYADVRVASFSGGASVDLLTQARVPLQVFERQFRWDVRPAGKLRAIIDEWQPDVVHTWGWMSSAASTLPCRLRRIPLVDGSIRTGTVPARRGWVQSRVVRRADAVIANSQAGLDAYGVRGYRGYVVRNAFEPSRLGLCQNAGGEPEFDAVMAGRIVHGKDFECFLEAGRLLRDGRRRLWKLALVGSGDMKERLLLKHADLVNDGTASFIDGGTEALPTIARAAIGVLLTDTRYLAEGTSNSIMEYMACGLPVVCSDGGGNREIVVDGTTGIVLGEKSPERVAEAICKLREDPDLARAYGQAGRQRIQDAFTVDSLVNSTIRVYRDVGVEVGQAS